MVPWKLWAAVAGLLAIDVILLLVWTLVDPLSREVSIALLLPTAILPYIIATNLFGSICSIIITLIPPKSTFAGEELPQVDRGRDAQPGGGHRDRPSARALQVAAPQRLVR